MGLVPAAEPAHAAPEWNPPSSYTSTDNGDGTYRVPLLNSDVPDVSVERLPADQNAEGRDIYYMISTTMHLSPGAPIMKSYDLVNWEIVNYVFDRADISDSFSLRNGETSYGQGQWASSLRHHDGKWYVAFNTNNLGGSYLYVTEDIDAGQWERIPLGRSFHDPSLFFDVDGTPYIFYGSGSTSAVKLSADFSEVLGEYPQIIRPGDYPGAPVGGLFEGAQVTFIDGQYYIVIITWPPGQGRQVVLFRSDELLGRYATDDGSNPYEARGVLNSNGFAQGSLVPIEQDGDLTYWGMFFRDNFPIGRIPALIPATWGEDGWPTFGNAGSVPVNGSFAKTIRLSEAEERLERQKSIVASDDFTNDAPHRAYMDEEWSIPAEPQLDQTLLGVELMSNAGFEDGTTAPWTAQYGATIALDGAGDVAATGGSALRVTGRSLNGSAPTQRLDGKLQHGVTYTVSAKVRYDTGPDSVQFNLVTDGARGVQVMTSASVPIGQWTTISGVYTVPANVDVGSLSFAVETPWGNPQPASSSVSYWLDDVSIVGAAPQREHPHPEEIAPNGSRLAMQWQWNHAPDNRHWSLTERDGWLRLTNGRVVTGDFRHTKLAGKDEVTWLEEARNTLTQRTFGPSQSVETKLDISGMKDGDVAGLAAFGRNFSYVGVRRVDGVTSVGVVNRVTPFAVDIDQRAVEEFLPETTVELGDATEIHLKADLDFSARAGQLWTTFLYSFDGIEWSPLGGRVGPQALDGTLSHFMGHRIGLFNYATQETGGWVDFDHFLLSDVRTAQNLPLDADGLDAAIAQARSLTPETYPADDWAAMQAALSAAADARSRPLGTQNQIDAPTRALSLELARLGLIDEAGPRVTITTSWRCLGGTAMLTARVDNAEDVPVSVRLSSDYAEKDLTVQAGGTAAHAFTTRQTSPPPGSLIATSTMTIGGEEVSTRTATPYAGHTCR
ncbi:family 43 glycosylhydrolase [Microbacterium sp. Sa4CUA7]|uniref:Family 43 glycosylhydrolase n=2 Tax=Microbacterium pullorum TaxID=2762236 RepID=A0ABR8S5Q4_9MICO|nr:family 43 glycosylhydrolase [Microbacterium pullorum]